MSILLEVDVALLARTLFKKLHMRDGKIARGSQ